MPAPQNVIALVFDFDDTLTDDSATRLLESRGIDPGDFWGNRVQRLVRDGWDPTVAYLTELLNDVGEGKPLGRLTNGDLGALGAGLTFYQGLPDLFTRLRAVVQEHRLSSPSIEFFIVSSGLEEIIRGSGIARYFAGTWGCCFEEQGGQIARIKNVISFTDKTRFLFAINKGVDNRVRQDAYAVNTFVAPEDRRVPWENMIYVGDGLTDVPCFSLLQYFRGQAFGVFDPMKTGSPKKAWEQLLVPRRVATMNSPKYGETDDLGALLTVAVRSICLRLDARTGAV
jgi:hypothetical protein